MIGLGQEVLDTIFYRDWSQKTVKIIEVTQSDVVFQYPQEIIKNTESTSKIARVTFSSGRIQMFNKELGLHPDTVAHRENRRSDELIRASQQENIKSQKRKAQREAHKTELKKRSVFVSYGKNYNILSSEEGYYSPLSPVLTNTFSLGIDLLQSNNFFIELRGCYEKNGTNQVVQFRDSNGNDLGRFNTYSFGHYLGILPIMKYNIVRSFLDVDILVSPQINFLIHNKREKDYFIGGDDANSDFGWDLEFKTMKFHLNTGVIFSKKINNYSVGLEYKFSSNPFSDEADILVWFDGFPPPPWVTEQADKTGRGFSSIIQVKIGRVIGE